MRYFSICIVLFFLTTLCAWSLEPPIVTAPEVTTTPIVDGDISPDEWNNAAAVCGFSENTAGYPAIAKAQALLCYDEDALYVLFKCYGESSSELLGTLREHDSNVWDDSEVEIFLCPPSWDGKYAHFLLSHSGTTCDERGSGQGSLNMEWNPTWQSAVGKSDDFWFAEIAIPWKTLDISPFPGLILNANFGRHIPSANELSTWSHIIGTFHQSSFFGKIILGGKGNAVSVPEIPGIQVGRFNLSPVILGSSIEPLNITCTAVPMQSKSKTKKSSGQITPGGSFPLQMDYATKEITIKITGEKNKTIWQQSAKLDIPEVPKRIEFLRKTKNSMLKESILTSVEAENYSAALLSAQISSDGTNNRAEISQISANLDKLEQGLMDIKHLADAKKSRITDLVVAPSYYVTNPVVTDKIQLNAVAPGPLVGKLQIAMARGEYEAAQIVICPVKESLKGTLVTASTLTCATGEKITADRVVVTPIGSIECKTSTPGAKLFGKVPEVLLPNRKMDIEQGTRQPYFITVQSKPDDVPGIYSGVVLITTDKRETTVIPISVRVYNVTLPAKSHLRTAFVLWGNFRNFMDTSNRKDYLSRYISYSKTMLNYKISPITMWAPEKDAQGNWNFADYDTYCTQLVPLGLTTLNIGGDGDVVRQKNTDFITAAAAHFKDKSNTDWWDLHYVYGQDEAPASAESSLIEKYGALVNAVPDLKIMQTGWSPVESLKDLVKIWCPLTAHADLDTCYAAQKSGKEIWWYVCCVPTAPYANLFVDYPGIDHRILGWMTYKYKFTGLLYWGVDHWPGNDSTADYYDKTNYVTWKPDSFREYNGDGYLLYPGLGDVPVPSVRLALLRDGIEDYDLFVVARELAAKKVSPDAMTAKSLLKMDGKLIESLTKFTQNGEDLITFREKLLSACERLNNR